MSLNHRKNEQIAVIDLEVKWGGRMVRLGARFGGGVFLGIAVLAFLGLVVLYGQRWVGH